MGLTCLGMAILIFAVSESNSQLWSSNGYEPSRPIARTQSRPNSGFIGFQAPSENVEPQNGDISYRALATSHYRNFYRNRNFFAHNSDDESSYHNDDAQNTPTQASSSTDFSTPSIPSNSFGSVQRQKTSSYVRPSEYTTMSGTISSHKTSGESTWATSSQIASVSSDGPILFAEPTQPLDYIRPAQHLHASSPSTNTLVEIKKNELPGTNDVLLKGKYAPNIDNNLESQCPKGSTYCEQLDNYPKLLINEVLRRTYTPEKFHEVYGESTDNSSKVTDLNAILQRTGLMSGGPLEETPLCSSVEHTIYPRVAKNKENKWMYIVNHDEFIQGVRVEKCLDEGQSCFFGESVPAGYQTVCRQKFIYKKLLALTQEGKTSTDTFRLPSCCVCFVKTTPIADRLGFSSSSTKKLSTERFTTISTYSPQTKSTEPNDDEYSIDFQADEGIPTVPTNATTLKINDV